MSTEDKGTLRYAREKARSMNSARNFPYNTCPASRHVAMMAETLANHGAYPMLQEEPRHCAGSLAATVEALWQARATLAQLGYVWRDGEWREVTN